MNTFTCPYCGGEIEAVKRGEETEMKRGLLSRLFGPKGFEAGRMWEPSIAQPIAQPQQIGRPVVSRDPVMTRYVQLPLTAAIIFGLFASLALTLVAAIIVVATRARGWWLASVPITFAISALIVAGFVWYKLFRRSWDILEFLERLTGVDINADGKLGKQPIQKESVLVETVNKEERRVERDELPVKDVETLRQVAHAVLRLNCNLSKRNLAKHTKLSEEKALGLLTEMRNGGFARFSTNGKPESGTVLTKKGLDLLESLL